MKVVASRSEMHHTSSPGLIMATGHYGLTVLVFNRPSGCMAQWPTRLLKVYDCTETSVYLRVFPPVFTNLMQHSEPHATFGTGPSGAGDAAATSLLPSRS